MSDKIEITVNAPEELNRRTIKKAQKKILKERVWYTDGTGPKVLIGKDDFYSKPFEARLASNNIIKMKKN